MRPATSTDRSDRPSSKPRRRSSSKFETTASWPQGWLRDSTTAKDPHDRHPDVAGFLYDVVSWARAGHRSIDEVLLQYWWAVLFALSVGIAALAKRGKGA